MAITPTPCAWWHTKPAQAPEPGEMLARAIAALDAQMAMPPVVVCWLASALRELANGTSTDLTKALGLRPRRGGRFETVASRAMLSRRNEALLMAYHAAPGSSQRERCRNVAEMLSNPVTEAEAFRQLRAEFGAEIKPLSISQIKRVVSAAQ